MRRIILIPLQVMLRIGVEGGVEEDLREFEMIQLIGNNLRAEVAAEMKDLKIHLEKGTRGEIKKHHKREIKKKISMSIYFSILVA